MSPSDWMPRRGANAVDPVAATEKWFVRHGLPYFLPSERKAARKALQPRRLLPLVILTVLLGIALAALLVWASDDFSAAPAVLTLVGLLVAVGYAVTAMRARPIIGWALRRTLGSLNQLVPMVTRALPLLLLFVTFLFINAECWQVASSMDGGVLWLTVVLFTLMGIGFFLVRLPEEIERADDLLDEQRIVAVSDGTPLADEAARLARKRGADLVREAKVAGYERANLTVALLITQTAQVFLLALSVLLFFLVFGSLVMTETVVESWTGGQVHTVPGLPNVSVELLQVSVFLAAFSGLYVTVYAVTDETYRDQFFTGVMAELERAIALRAVYTVAREERGDPVQDEADETWSDPTATVPFEPVTPPSRSPGDR